MALSRVPRLIERSRRRFRGAAGARPLHRAKRVVDVEIVGFKPELLDKAAELRTAVFGGTTELNRDYLAWKYSHNPYLVDPIICFAVSADRVVGMYGGMGSCWELCGSRHIFSHGAELMVDSRLRGQGIARRLQHGYITQLRARGIGFAFSLSGGSVGTSTMVAGGWRLLTMLETLERRTERRGVLAKVVGRTRALLPHGHRGGGPDPLAAVTSDDDSGVRLLGADAANRLAEIASRASPSDRLRHVRDEEYFCWRLRNPLNRYRVLASDDAYLILQWSGQGTRVNLLDWRGADARSVSSVFRVGLRGLTNVSVWRISLDPELRALLEGSGFRQPAHRQFASFTMNAVTGDIRDARLGATSLSDPEHWELRMLDSDMY